MVRGFIFVGLLAINTAASAHGGGLDKHGCHHDRKSGGYHCHRGASSNDATSLRRQSQDPSLQGDDSDSGPFSSCAQARAAGAAPVRRGDPGYSRRLDRDGDGVGCE